MKGSRSKKGTEAEEKRSAEGWEEEEDEEDGGSWLAGRRTKRKKGEGSREPMGQIQHLHPAHQAGADQHNYDYYVFI